MLNKAQAGAWGRMADRGLDILPILTTLCLLAIYPALRYGRSDPFLAELFRFGFITFWIGFLIFSMIRALKTRRDLRDNLETDWWGRLQAGGHRFSHYVILMPLKHETNRHVLFQTLRAVERQQYPSDLVTLVPIIEAEDHGTLERVQEIVPAFAGVLRLELLVYPAEGVAPRCKATSVTTAGRWLSRRVAAGEFGDVPIKVLIIDADTILHPQDLAAREARSLEEDGAARARRSRGVILQSLTTYTANYWKVPMLPRLHNTGFVLYQMGKMQSRGDYLVLGPGTSLPFEIFEAVEFFEPNRHNEDMQFRYKVVMEGYRVAPLRMPTWGQAPLTARESWAQIARWARGAVDVKFILQYRPRLRARLPLTKRRPFLALRALFANAVPPLMVLVPAQLILISWLSPCVKSLWGLSVFLSPDVLALKMGAKSVCVSAMAAFNLRFQTVVLTSSMLLGMLVVPHTLRPVIYQRAPRRWRSGRRFFEWFRLTFTPVNLHNYLLMASAQLYTQTRLALGFSISQTEVTRK